MTIKSKRYFWSMVKLCLRKFHGQSDSASQNTVQALRKRLGKLTKEAEELVYHVEPFNLACDLIGNDIRDKKIHKEYIELRDKAIKRTYQPAKKSLRSKRELATSSK